MGIFKKLQDIALSASGAAVGYLEFVGLKYPVKHYMFKVSNVLTRGSRLDAKGIAHLREQGFRMIVNLCAESNMDARPSALYGIKCTRIKIIDNKAPTEEQMIFFVRTLKDPANQPTYVHCEAGKGRTGVAVACYRMAIEGWPTEKAIAEAKEFGMAMPTQEAFLLKFGDGLSSGRITI